MGKVFKEFITKGNLIQLAIAFVMGAAFATMVKSFVDDLIMPIIGKLIGNVDFADLYINLSGGTYESAAIYYGIFVNTVITFIIVALVMFLIARLAIRMQRPAPEAAPTVKVCPYCKTEIPIDAVRCPHCTSQLNSA